MTAAGRSTVVPDLASILARRPARHTPPLDSDPAPTDPGPSIVARPDDEEQVASPTDLFEDEQVASALGRVVAEPSGRTYLSQISFYVPRSIHVRLAERARSDGTTMTVVVLAALNETHLILPTSLQETKRQDGQLFHVPQRTTARQIMVEGKIRVTDEQLNGLGELARRLGVSRSKLIAAALALYL